jgi:hypothetical protein
MSEIYQKWSEQYNFVKNDLARAAVNPEIDWVIVSQSNLQDRIPRYTTISLIQHVIIWQKRQHNKYGGNIGNVCRSIDFDIKHGVTIEEVLVFLDKVRNDPIFSNINDHQCRQDRKIKRNSELFYHLCSCLYLIATFWHNWFLN